MEFIIQPYVGAGKIQLGMSSLEIQTALNSPPKKFRKLEDDQYETDAYHWCHVFFKEPVICEAIEFFAPATVIFHEKNLIGKPYSEVKNFVLKLDSELVLEETGFTSLNYGFGVYAPFAEDDPFEPVEGVIIFEKGYYD